LKNVLEKSDSPTNQNNGKKPLMTEPMHFFEFQMTIPCKCHKRIGNN